MHTYTEGHKQKRNFGVETTATGARGQFLFSPSNTQLSSMEEPAALRACHGLGEKGHRQNEPEMLGIACSVSRSSYFPRQQAVLDTFTSFTLEKQLSWALFRNRAKPYSSGRHRDPRGKTQKQYLKRNSKNSKKKKKEKIKKK